MTHERTEAETVVARGGGTAPRATSSAAATGLLAGLLAQTCTLSQEQGAVAALGMSTALWVTIAFLLARRAAETWSGGDRLPWISVVVAVYLFAWLLAYEALYGVVQHVAFWTVWGDSWVWIVAVAPACVVIALLAIGSLRHGVIGDVCLSAPLAWSLAQCILTAHGGWSEVIVVAVPTLLAAGIPLFAARGRRWNPLVVTVAALLGGAAVLALLAFLRMVSSQV